MSEWSKPEDWLVRFPASAVQQVGGVCERDVLEGIPASLEPRPARSVTLPALAWAVITPSRSWLENRRNTSLVPPLEPRPPGSVACADRVSVLITPCRSWLVNRRNAFLAPPLEPPPPGSVACADRVSALITPCRSWLENRRNVESPYRGTPTSISVELVKVRPEYVDALFIQRVLNRTAEGILCRYQPSTAPACPHTGTSCALDFQA